MLYQFVGLGPTDDQAGNEHVAVLSYGLWKQRFDANPAIVGTRVRLDGQVYDVIGVMPERFDYLDNAERLWVPLVLSKQRLIHPDEHYLDVVGRLREDDLMILTADHGNDPTTPSTDHSREAVTVLVVGPKVKPASLGTRTTFAHMGATIAEYFGLVPAVGKSFLRDVLA